MGCAFEAREGLLKRRSSPTASVVDEGQASPTAAADAGDPHGDNDDWDLKVAVGLNDVKRAGA